MEAEQLSDVPTAPARLMSRDFTLLWLGQTVSQLGNQAYSIGMVFWLMKATGSASLMGLLLTVSSLPGVLLGPFGGTFADRHSRIRIIVVSDLLAGCGIGVLALALWLRSDDTRLVIALLFTVSILLGIARAAFGPALSAAIPELVPGERLAAANSLNQISVQGSVFVGQAVGGVLYGVVGAPVLFLLDALSFFFAAGTGSLIPRDPPRATTPSTEHPFRRFVHETAEGFRYVWARKGMRDFLFGVSLINFLAMPGTVLFPFFVELYLHAGPSWYGFLMASLSIGAVTGFILAGTLRLRGTRRMQGVLAAMFLYPVCFSILALLRTPWLAVLALFAGGVTVGVINVYLITLLQAATVSELRGRVMGLLGTLSGGLIPLGMALGGVVGDLTGKNVPLIILVTSGVAFVVVVSLAVRPSCREFLRGT
jgi:MFS family permease